MAPTPEEIIPEVPPVLIPEDGDTEAPSLDSQRVVISGVSGQYPSARHVKELSENLYNKVNPMAEPKTRWVYDNPEVPPYTGMIPDLNRFDAQFFKVHYRLCVNMDPMSRKILEHTYQAIYDAGRNPEHLSGKKIGVFVGTCLSETEKAMFYGAKSRTGFGIAGCNKSMFANRISYWLNIKGPSQAVDAACCSSTVALEMAYLAMSRGDCEAAIVAGANICLHPQTSVHYSRAIKLSKDGQTKSYDQNADGCVRSEAITVLFLQKASNALRIYGEVVNVKNSFTTLQSVKTGQRYGFCRNLHAMTTFLKEFYDETKVSPNDVEYVEGHGAGDPESDKMELEAFDKIFCGNRADPLRVGSVMSNVGFCEPASGATAITKVLLGYHKGELASNLHCTTPRTDVAGLREGRLQIVTDHHPIKRTYLAVNGLSITGVNSHVLLHGHYKPKDTTKYQCNIPRLVLLTARQDSSVEKVIADLKSRPIDPEEIALLQNIHTSKINGHLGRGYVLLDTDAEQKTVSLGEKSDYFDASDRPLWFVYSGMGSQWAGMGAALMRIPIFAAAIERCRKALEPKGIDIVHIITSPDKTIYDNILHSFVGIAAIQIGLTDILHALGLVPDKIIGHSVGELGCAYADGCMTAEEMILSSYSRGLVSVETPFIKGSMAAVGIGFQEVSKMCPPEIEVACHNGPDSSTISGPADVMREFVAQLTAKGIFAKEVPCSNIAYHSRYIAEAGPSLKKYLSDVLKTPKLRSERWVSTSVPQDKWDQETAKYSSAHYHTNNLLSPVLFEETSRLVPPGAVLVEVAPHGLLQAILKRSLPPSCSNVPLTRRGHEDNARFFLDAIGKLFMQGCFPDVRALYPKVEFPVSTGTPMLSHLVEWAHNETWLLPLYAGARRKMIASCTFVLSIHDIENNYLKGHKIQGKTSFPFAGVLVAAWDTLAMTLGESRRKLPVRLHDVHLYAQPMLHDTRSLRLSVTLHRGTGMFEISDNGSKVASGYIVPTKIDHENEEETASNEDVNFDDMELKSDDIYEILNDRSYMFGGEFRSIYDSNTSFSEGHLTWEGNWVTFIDGMLQYNALRQPHDGVSRPVFIKNMIIDTDFKIADDQTKLKINVCTISGHTRCGGVLMESVGFHNLARSNRGIELKTLKFIPRFPVQNNLNVQQILQVFAQIVAENINGSVINIVEIRDNKQDPSIFESSKNISEGILGTSISFNEIYRGDLTDNLVKTDLILCTNLSTDDIICQNLYEVIKPNIFIITAENVNENLNRVRPKALYNVVSAQNTENTRFELVQWRPKTVAATSAFSIRTSSDLALLHTTRANLPPQNKMILLASYPPVSGLKDLVKEWRKESERNQIHLITFKDQISEGLIMDELPDLALAFNVVNQPVISPCPSNWNTTMHALLFGGEIGKVVVTIQTDSSGLYRVPPSDGQVGELGGEYFLPLQEKPRPENEIALKSERIGDLGSLQWVEASDFGGSGVPVKIHFAGLNACDIKRANGEVPFETDSYISDSYYGMDFSGTTESGDRVMGVVRCGALRDRVRARPELLWPVPEHWSLEDAATVPLPYAQAFYCLAIRNQLMPGMVILVGGGAGALGQAIISIALHLECRVFVVVGDAAKKRFLLKLFPDLRADNVICCRDHTFKDVVLTATGGLGCDFVFCGKGKSKHDYLNCTNIHGIALDVDQIKSNENFVMGMNFLSKERIYQRIDFSSILQPHGIKTIKEIQWMISEGIKSGVVRPLSRVTYAPSDAERAFRLLAASRHRGRVLLRLQPTLPQPAVPRIVCSAQHCQLIISDDEGLALQLADRLVKRGSRALALHLYTATFSPRFDVALKSWQNLGVKVNTSTEDITDNKRLFHLLNETLRMAPVEGIFVAISHAPNDQTKRVYQSLIVNLDSAARTLCPSIKYFVVVGPDSSIGEHTCLARSQDQLPAMMLSVPTLAKVDSEVNTSDLISKHEMFNAMEQGLRSKQPVVVVHESPTKETPSLLQQIIAVAGVNVSENTAETATLKDLGITLDRANDVSILLRSTADIVFDKEQIPVLTIQKIQELDEMVRESVYTPKRGLHALFSYVDPDELQVTADMISMLTMSSNSKQRDDEFDHNQTFLCILPGMEGHSHRFHLMCERLKLAAVVLQPGLDNPNETFQEITARYVKHYRTRITAKKFYLLGYEIGVPMALEMAAMLEDQGLTGTVYCLGGGPDEFSADLEEHLREAVACSHSNEEWEQALQDAVILHMCALMADCGSTQLEAALRNASSWEEKLAVAARTLCGRVAYSAQYTRSVIESAYARVMMARQRARVSHEPRILNSQIILLRSPPSHPSAVESLQRYSRLPVIVHDLRAPLTNAPDDLRVATFVNQNVEEKVLKEFESKSLCDTYLVNPLDFMGGG